MYDCIKLFLTIVGYFFIAYLIGYSTFLFLSVIVGSLDLYKRNRREKFEKHPAHGLLSAHQHHRARLQRGDHRCGHGALAACARLPLL